MKKLIVEYGAPASGKSTCARKRCAKDKSFVRINLDDIRTMGFGLQFWNQKREAWVQELERKAVISAFDNGFNAVVDSTNLKPERLQYWKDVAELNGAVVEVCDHSKVPHSMLLLQDSMRKGHDRVGQVVIDRMLAYNGMLPKPTRKVVICDIDGTVANLEHRKFLIAQPPKKWHMFYQLVSMDEPIDSTIKMVRELSAEMDIWVVSGRCDFHVEGDSVARVADDTVDWLHRNNIPFKHIFMRRENDRRPDTEVKRDILENEILKNIPLEQIDRVIDDRPSVIRMWREHGLQVVDVGPGVEF